MSAGAPVERLGLRAGLLAGSTGRAPRRAHGRLRARPRARERRPAGWTPATGGPRGLRRPRATLRAHPAPQPGRRQGHPRMTELDRHRRAQDLDARPGARELPRTRTSPSTSTSSAPGFRGTEANSRRRPLILARLRERLFELSRRNRSCTSAPRLQSLNLTLASVPSLSTPEHPPEQLFTWQPEVERSLADAPDRPRPMAALRGRPYLPGVLDKLISEARRDRAEFGFSQLRLVVCFLRWHNLKASAAGADPLPAAAAAGRAHEAQGSPGLLRDAAPRARPRSTRFCGTTSGSSTGSTCPTRSTPADGSRRSPTPCGRSRPPSPGSS